MVVRGPNEGDFASALRKIARHIVGHHGYSGPGFSEADLRIRQISDGASGPGNATSWRALNMGRHITKVVSDLGAKRGYTIEQREVARMPTQVVLPNLLDPTSK